MAIGQDRFVIAQVEDELWFPSKAANGHVEIPDVAVVREQQQAVVRERLREVGDNFCLETITHDRRPSENRWLSASTQLPIGEPFVHYVQRHQSSVGWPSQLVEREPQAAADEEKRHHKEGALRGRVPEEEASEEVLHCIRNSIAIYSIYLIYTDFSGLQSLGTGVARQGSFEKDVPSYSGVNGPSARRMPRSDLPYVVSVMFNRPTRLRTY